MLTHFLCYEVQLSFITDLAIIIDGGLQYNEPFRCVCVCVCVCGVSILSMCINVCV